MSLCRPLAGAFVCLLACVSAAASPLVTGNGFGFAVVSPDTGTVTKFYAHPYSFARPDSQNLLSEGVETSNFIKRLGWTNEGASSTTAEYAEDSQIIHTRSGPGDGLVFMPFGLRQTALIISWNPGSPAASLGHWYVDWNRPVSSQRVIRMFGTDMQVLKFNGIHESLLLIPLGKKPTKPGDPQQTLSTSLAWALVSIESDGELEPSVREFNRWRGALAPEELAKREIAEIEQWRVNPSIDFRSEKERHLWRQSEMVLRMAQSREPNRPDRYNNGLIVAFLPDGFSFMPWVRDMAYAVSALARMGHRDEARAAILAYFNARPAGQLKQETGGLDYQVSVVRYFGDGSEEPFFTMEGSTNIEFDNWGLVLWVLGEYFERYHDPDLLRYATYRGALYESAKEYVVKPLLANVEKYNDGLILAADTSIWEERQKDKKHFAFSTVTAIVGLQAFAEIARRQGDQRTCTNILNQVSLLKKGFEAAFIRDGKLRGTLEEGVKNDIDGALLSVINFGLVTDPAIVHETMVRMQLLKVASGGYRRVRSTYTDPSIYEYWYERQEFLFVDFNLAEVYWRLGRDKDADLILEQIVNKAAADHNFIPEMYVALDCRLFHGEIGDPTGAIPMVGYGAGAYIRELLARPTTAAEHLSRLDPLRDQFLLP